MLGDIRGLEGEGEGERNVPFFNYVVENFHHGDGLFFGEAFSL